MVRAAALLALLAALVGWYESAKYLSALSLWPEVLVISLVVMPVAMYLVWLALPLWRSRLTLPLAVACVLLAAGFHFLHVPVGENFSKLAALTLAGWWFLTYFEALSWVVLVSLLIPWVDAYSVWRGPTKALTSGKHEHVFDTLSIAFAGPGPHKAEQLGLPDVLFFAVFLGASVRFRLRPAATWGAMTALLVVTVVIAIAGIGPNGGLPALPAISLGFLIPNADLLWARLRRQPALEH